MREYFIFSYIDDDNQATIDNYELGDFNSTLLWNGDKLPPNSFKNIRLELNSGYLPDYLPNPLSWPIFSLKLWTKVAPLIESTCQLFDAPIYRNNKRLNEFYYIVNILSIVPPKNLEKVGYEKSEDLVIDKRRVPAEYHIFRVPENSSLVFGTDVLIGLLLGTKFRGIGFVKCK